MVFTLSGISIFVIPQKSNTSYFNTTFFKYAYLWGFYNDASCIYLHKNGLCKTAKSPQIALDSITIKKGPCK